MLYMVEMDLPDRTRINDWHTWYVNHIGKLLTVPGFHGSQRFESLTPTASPFLAIHDVDGPGFFTSDGYKSTGGPASTGEWQSKMTNWYRNLFDGIEHMAEVGAAQHLVVLEDGAEPPGSSAARVTWLTAAGLDLSAERRGFIILEASENLAQFEGCRGVRIFKPITAKLT